ncbi:MAG TPA: excinuclease ABC subunit UvrC [Candidatus Butyricicoccus stercorigallinarum]|nr:excinuclease ABC subunit UvrC [Candidatus Butyricicoccus stercorigallinarum]
MSNREQLHQRVRTLPREPGVYLMKNRQGQVIYVGKAKALKNRVSQYFQNEARHTPKTRKMVEHIDSFDIIVCESEFEALVLENEMIKKYQPKYNILLKDDKGYPFIRVSTDRPYPEFTVVGRRGKDTARYLGPYAGRGAATQAIDTVSRALGLRTCRRVLPRDIGKARPCLNAQLGRCCAPCAGAVSQEEYAQRVAQAIDVLEGNYQQLAAQLEQQMMQAAEEERFEQAAQLRDRMRAITRAGQHQMVVASGFSDTDVIAFVQGETRGCIVTLHYIAGNFHDKEYTMLDGTSSEDGAELLGSYIKQYYALRGVVPPLVLVSEEIEDAAAVEAFLRSVAGRAVSLTVPQRGRRRELMQMARKNAQEEIVRIETSAERHQKSLELFGSMMGLAETPVSFEAYDISNLAGTNTVGSMVVFEDGKPKRSRYRRFRIASVASGQDDYRAMEEMLTRRMQRWKDGDEKFSALPSVFLIDGGLGHVRVASQVLERFGCGLPVFGMVKDDHHRTRGLVAPDGREFSISATPAVFALVGRIQEEVHRFAITYQRQLRGSDAVRSELSRIPGVGEKRRAALFRKFHSVGRMRAATVEELEAVVPRAVAQAVYAHFHSAQEENES